jgi:hypothetical protein
LIAINPEDETIHIENATEIVIVNAIEIATEETGNPIQDDETPHLLHPQTSTATYLVKTNLLL